MDLNGDSSSVLAVGSDFAGSNPIQEIFSFIGSG